MYSLKERIYAITDKEDRFFALHGIREAVGFERAEHLLEDDTSLLAQEALKLAAVLKMKLARLLDPHAPLEPDPMLIIEARNFLFELNVKVNYHLIEDLDERMALLKAARKAIKAEIKDVQGEMDRLVAMSYEIPSEDEDDHLPF